LRKVVILTVTGVLSQGIAFVYRILLTRMAGAEILGLYQLILPVYGVLLSLTGAGLYTGVCNLTARYGAMHNRRAIKQVVGQAVRLFFLLAVLPCLLLLVFSDGVSVWILGDARTRLGLLLLVPCLLLTGTENLHKNYFYGIGKILPPAVTEILEQLLRAGLVLSFLVFLRPDTPEKTLGVIVLGMSVCEVCAAVTQIALFRWHLHPAGEEVPEKRIRSQLWQIALPLGGAAVLGNLISSANAVLIPRLLVLGGMEQREAVSAYGVTFGMSLPLLLLPTAFLGALGLVLTPALSHAHALGNLREIQKKIRRSVGAANLVLIPSLALLGAFGGEIGAFFYRDARVGEHLPLLALGVLFACWQGLFAHVLVGLGRQGISAVLSLLFDGLQLILTCLTVANWGLRGYALSFVLCAGLCAFFHWIVVKRAADLTLPVFSWLFAPALSALLGVFCGKLMERALLHGGLSPLAGAWGGLVFGGLLYLAALQAMGVNENSAHLPQ